MKLFKFLEHCVWSCTTRADVVQRLVIQTPACESSFRLCFSSCSLPRLQYEPPSPQGVRRVRSSIFAQNLETIKMQGWCQLLQPDWHSILTPAPRSNPCSWTRRTECAVSSILLFWSVYLLPACTSHQQTLHSTEYHHTFVSKALCGSLVLSVFKSHSWNYIVFDSRTDHYNNYIVLGILF